MNFEKCHDNPISQKVPSAFLDENNDCIKLQNREEDHQQMCKMYSSTFWKLSNGIQKDLDKYKSTIDYNPSSYIGIPFKLDKQNTAINYVKNNGEANPNEFFAFSFENYLATVKNSAKTDKLGSDDEEVKNDFIFEADDDNLNEIYNSQMLNLQKSSLENPHDKRSLIGRDSNEETNKRKNDDFRFKNSNGFERNDKSKSVDNNFVPSLANVAPSDTMMEMESTNQNNIYEDFDPGRPSVILPTFYYDRNGDAMSHSGRTDKTQNKSEKSTHQGCKCKNSKCLKLYCDCFASRTYCGSQCSCTDCYSRPEFDKILHEFYDETLSKNPTAFRTKIKQVETNEIQVHSRGCNCKKSNCLKDYCECHAAGILCTALCKCKDCSNFNHNIEKKELEVVQEKVQRRRRRCDKKFGEIFNEKMMHFQNESLGENPK